MGFLPSCSCINTTVWMHHIDANKTHGEKASGKLHKNAACCFELILEATFHKTAVVRLPTSHITINPSKMNNTSETQLEKLGQTHERCCLIEFYAWTHHYQPTNKDLHKSALCRHWMPS